LVAAVKRLQYPLLATALALFLILGWRGREPINITTTDENTYLALSRSLESGSYREIYLANAPIHVKYPPAYPAFIMAIRLVLGDNVDVIRAANLLVLAGSIALMFLLARLMAGEVVALCVAFLLAINHALLNSGGTLLSESLFIGLSTAALFVAVRADGGRDKLVYWAIALALASFLTRTAGIAFVGAIGVWLVSRRRPRELVVFAVSSLVVVGAWLAYITLVPDQAGGRSYGADIAAGFRATPESSPLVRMVGSFGRNLVHYSTRTVPTLLGVPTASGTKLDNVAWLGALLVFLPAGVFALWKRARAVAAGLLLYAVMLVVWPWLQARVVVPLVPLTMLCLVLGAQSLSRLLPGGVRKVSFALVILLLGFGGSRAALARDAAARHCDLATPYQGNGCLDDLARGVGNAALYVREHAPPDAVVLTVEGAGVNYVSGRLTLMTPILVRMPPDQILEQFRQRNIRYVLLSGQTRRIIVASRILLPLCRDFRVLQHFGPQVTLLAPEAAGHTGEDGCAVLGALAAINPHEEP
jgi:4-amino-4-deoxy-L-arabinose transferase-like glycosyltransferase